MDDYEKLGSFYLGRVYDLDAQKAKDELLLYNSKDLTTHAVCVGMTGSGKTGLCMALIEEAAIDGVPAILIDPKGDLANLLLTFPQLRGQDFLPWINQDEARQKGISDEEYANKQADTWKNGLASWNQSGERIQRLRDMTDIRIYTPGSSAGISVSILKSFAAPAQAIRDDNDMLRERVSTTATSLLGLVGIEADPVQSREHILLSTILDNAWRNGQDMDLAALIQQVQTPPVTKIGVLDLKSFYPSKERFGLVMALNNLIASPGFSTWLQGTPLDIKQILYTPDGKPRIAIFSIAHLSDPERMFFVSLLMKSSSKLDARSAWHDQPARTRIYGRDLWLSPAARQSSIKTTHAHAAQASACIRRWHGVGNTKSGGSRLQGAFQYRHLVHWSLAD
ncbi:MAG: DUF87 domain-containing protein [Anaerolineales bacterium]